MLQRKDMIPAFPQSDEIAKNIATYAIPLINCMKVLKSMGFSSYEGKDNSSVQEMNLIIKDL